MAEDKVLTVAYCYSALLVLTATEHLDVNVTVANNGIQPADPHLVASSSCQEWTVQEYAWQLSKCR